MRKQARVDGSGVPSLREVELLCGVAIDLGDLSRSLKRISPSYTQDDNESEGGIESIIDSRIVSWRMAQETGRHSRSPELVGD